ncbi:hypothetical protein I3842_05G194700 [Carya illinoinensis]|uniref:Uncharacterized protein n=1 Tax=Carya illinoinensis TaxID=32201 RepID=A0A922JND6_CARIL|nr:hypothetical protein I3842_05G194700 [Carya illinoinensis]
MPRSPSVKCSQIKLKTTRPKSPILSIGHEKSYSLLSVRDDLDCPQLLAHHDSHGLLLLSIAYLFICVFKVVEELISMTQDLYIRFVVPIAALYSLSLWFSSLFYLDAQGHRSSRSTPSALSSKRTLSTFKSDHNSRIA